MRTNPIKTIFLMTIFSLTISCRKEGDSVRTSQINVPKFQDCCNSHPHDSTTVTNKLIGTWDWQEQSCMNSSSAASAIKVVKATFSSSGIFSVIENASVISQGNWKVNMIGSNFFAVDSSALELYIDVPSSYIYGLIFLCDNQLLLCGSYADGCNTLFKKE